MSESLLSLLIGWCAFASAAAWLAPKTWLPYGLLAAGIGFLAMADIFSLALLAFGACVVLVVTRGFKGRRLATITGVLLLATGYLAFITTAPRGFSSGIASGVVLPLGMAFSTLRLIHVLIEHYKGSLRDHTAVEFLAYLLLPGALPVGPIHRLDDFIRDLRRHRRDPNLLSSGLERLLYGLVKVVFICNYLLQQKIHPLLEATAPATLLTDHLGLILSWCNLYMAFSGFSDIAIGTAAMAGFRLRENFDWPFLASDIAEFWRRWHISLALWCRDYVYTPVLAISRRPVMGVLAAMVVLGLWHELSLRYLLWGVYHGLGIAAHRAFVQRAAGAAFRHHRWWNIVATLMTLHFVLFSFPVTKAVASWLSSL